MSRAAIVILNYNGEKLLQQFLPIVIEHSAGHRIIVADNASTDRSINILQKDFPVVEVIQLDKNYGFCGGYNRALKQVEADYYVLLNSDIEVTPKWLAPMIALLDEHESVAAVQPKILSYILKTKFEHAGAGGGFIDALGYPYCRGRIFDHVEDDRGQYNDSREVFWASGACMVIRTKAFHLFNGFDEDYFAHMEEIDLCWKLQRNHQQVYYCGASTVYHVGAGTLSYGHSRKVYLNFRNGLFLIFKHLPSASLFYKLPIRLILDWLAAVRFMLSGQLNHALAVLKAHVSFFGNLSRETEKRKFMLKAYPFFPGRLISATSIVFSYYIKGKKTFDQ